MTAKKWCIMFVLSVILIIGMYAMFNILVDPFGVFGDKIFNWYSYNMTNNPRVAKINYLDKHFREYDSYIIGCSSTSSLPVEAFNKYFNAKAYNMIMYGADMLDVEQTCEYIINNYEVKNIVVNVAITNGAKYNYEEDNITKNLHEKVNGESKLSFYTRYAFLNPEYSIAKIKSKINDTYLTQTFDVFNEKTGSYDKKVRDVEPINTMDNYLKEYPVFASYPTGHDELDEIDGTIESLKNIVNMCKKANINLIVLSVPMYYDYMKYYDMNQVQEFQKRIVEVTPFWDFELSSISKEPRYFYDETHLRNAVGQMVIAKIANASDTYIPKDFGEYVTKGNIEEHLKNMWNVNNDKNEYTKEVKILMYHHITKDADQDSEITPETFENQIMRLKEAGYVTVTMENLVNYVEKGIELPEYPLCITFDDGYLSNYEIAYPILKKYDMKATIFVIGSTVGNINKYKNTEFAITPHFNFKQAEEMTNSGLISIQSHTYDMHQWKNFETGNNIRNNILKLEKETEEQYINYLTNDYTKSKNEIENNLNNEVFALAYPNGKYDILTNVVLNKLGVKVTLTTKNGINTIIKGLPQSLYALKRINMSENINMDEII